MEDHMTFEEKMAEFDNFIEKMDQRLLKAHGKYGDEWLTCDFFKEIEEELLDIANYAYLFYRRLQLLKKKVG